MRKVLPFYLDTCGFTHKDNVSKKDLLKYYTRIKQKETVLSVSLYNLVKKLSVFEKFNNGLDEVPYLLVKKTK